MHSKQPRFHINNVKHLLDITKEYKNLKQLVILNIFIEMN